MDLEKDLKLIDQFDDNERLQLIRDRALELFEGNPASVDSWLNSTHAALNSITPLQCSESIDGTKKVLMLIGRLEHGVFS